MVKKIVYNESARKALKKGMLVLAKAAGLTLGPTGRSVVLQKSSGAPQITNNGATVVKEVELSNQLENMGVELLRQVSLKTSQVAGDGAATTAVLAYAIAQEGMKCIAAGISPLLIKKGIDKAVYFVISKLLDYSVPIDNFNDVASIAAVSASSNNEIGLIVAEAIKKAGREGFIALEEGSSSQTCLEISEGLSFECGFMSPHFLLKSETGEISQDKPAILLVDGIIANSQDLIPLLEQLAALERPLLIIAKDILPATLNMLAMNRLKGIVDVVAVRAPDFGSTTSQVLEDLAILTKGNVVSDALGLDLSNVSLDFTGSAVYVTVSRLTTKIVASSASESVFLRCNQISKQIELTTNVYDRQKLQTRLSKLRGGAAVIKLGASTQSEMKYKKLCFKDAINAAKSALDEGIVPGGGSTFLHLAAQLDLCSNHLFASSQELVGARIISKALLAPLEAIAENSGSNARLVAERVKMMNFPMGYDASTATIVDMYKYGIIDSTKVIRLALQNSSSVASIILTTECAISDQLM